MVDANCFAKSNTTVQGRALELRYLGARFRWGMWAVVGPVVGNQRWYGSRWRWRWWRRRWWWRRWRWRCCCYGARLVQPGRRAADDGAVLLPSEVVGVGVDVLHVPRDQVLAALVAALGLARLPDPSAKQVLRAQRLHDQRLLAHHPWSNGGGLYGLCGQGCIVHHLWSNGGELYGLCGQGYLEQACGQDCMGCVVL